MGNYRPYFQWMSSRHKTILKKIEGEEGAQNVDTLKDQLNRPTQNTDYTIDEVRKFCKKLVQEEFIRQTNEDKYEITRVGKMYLEGDIDEFELRSRPVPISVRLSRKIGRFVLRLLDALESSQFAPIKDVESAKEQVEYHFLRAFRERLYSYTSVILLVLLGWISIRFCIGPNASPDLNVVLTFLGSIILVRGVVKGRKGIAVDTEEAAGRLTGLNQPPLMPSVVRAKSFNVVDAVWAALLITLGFVIVLV